MNTTTAASTTTEIEKSINKRKSLMTSHVLDKKRTMRSLSLRPTRSVKRTNSVVPAALKLK